MCSSIIDVYITGQFPAGKINHAPAGVNMPVVQRRSETHFILLRQKSAAFMRASSTSLSAGQYAISTLRNSLTVRPNSIAALTIFILGRRAPLFRPPALQERVRLRCQRLISLLSPMILSYSEAECASLFSLPRPSIPQLLQRQG